jgi:hypothetical protein
MKALTNIFKAAKVLSLTSALFLGMTQCSEEQIINEQQVAEDMVTEATSSTTDVASISVSGLFTEFAGEIECSTCSYMVDANEKVVDGKALGLKAGSVICLKKAVKYASVEFVNLEGSQQNPIVIGYCAK